MSVFSASSFSFCRRQAPSIYRPCQRCLSTTIRQPKSARGKGRPMIVSLAALFAASGGGWLWFQKKTSKPLCYSYFIPLPLHSITKLNNESSIFEIELPSSLLPDPALYPEPTDTPLQAVYIRQPELQIQRAYTPLSLDCFKKGGKPQDKSLIRFLVKRYHDGEVSSYLHRLRVGDDVFVRGPVRTWTVPEHDELVFIVGGTGITPLVQYLSQEGETPTNVKLVYASSNADTSLSRHLLAAHPGLNVNEVHGRLSERGIAQAVGKPSNEKKTVIIVCGPEGFVTSLAGPRSVNAAQKKIGGILGNLGWTANEVKKL